MYRNIILYLPLIIKIAFNLIGSMSRLKKEVPEALKSINQSREFIIDQLKGGLSPLEVDAIRTQLLKTWDEVDDVIDILAKILGARRE